MDEILVRVESNAVGIAAPFLLRSPREVHGWRDFNDFFSLSLVPCIVIQLSKSQLLHYRSLAEFVSGQCCGCLLNCCGHCGHGNLKRC